MMRSLSLTALAVVFWVGGVFGAVVFGLPMDGDQGLQGPMAVSMPDLPRWSPCEIIIKFKEGVEQDIKDELMARQGCSILRRCEVGDVHLVGISESETPEDLVSAFAGHDGVEYVELNHYVRIFLAPDDPYFAYQWNLYNRMTGGIQMEAAWAIETGDPNVVVAMTYQVSLNANGLVQ